MFSICVIVVAAAASCGRRTEGGTLTPFPQPSQVITPLAAFVAQRVALAPTGHVRGDSLGWIQQLGGARAVSRQLDSAVAGVFAERAVSAQWVMPADLIRSYERNRTYAADPRALALEQVRAPAFAAGSKYAEPLATQLRTMIALHENVRYVLLPIELRFEKPVGGSAARGVLRVALLDPRFTEARWVGDVRGDTAATPARALASVAAKLADLFVAP